MSRVLGIHCKLKHGIFIIAILLLIMIILALMFQYTVLEWTHMPTGYGIVEPLNEIEREQIKRTIQENVLKMQEVRNKMPFLGVNPHPYRYIHNVPDACRRTKVQLLIGVSSRTESFGSREAIRETWGQRNETSKIMTIFFLGTTCNKSVQKDIDMEASKYGDIVQEDFVDTYQNLSLKSVAFIKWVSLYCPNSTFVLKADDDVYINVPLLLTVMQKHFSEIHLFIIGKLFVDAPPNRKDESRYYLSPAIYPFKKFPSYFSGTAYAMTTTAAMKLYMTAFIVPPIFLEDVYLTGVVADRAAIPKLGDRRFLPWKIAPKGCAFKYKISTHNYTATDMRKMHRELWNEKRKC